MLIYSYKPNYASSSPYDPSTPMTSGLKTQRLILNLPVLLNYQCIWNSWLWHPTEINAFFTWPPSYNIPGFTHKSLSLAYVNGFSLPHKFQRVQGSVLRYFLFIISLTSLIISYPPSPKSLNTIYILITSTFILPAWTYFLNSRYVYAFDFLTFPLVDYKHPKLSMSQNEVLINPIFLWVCFSICQWKLPSF